MLALKVTTLLKISRTIVRQEQPVDAVASGQKQVQQRRLQLTDIDSAGDAEFLANDIRVKKGLDGLGCLGDMGWYCVRAALWAYGFEKPVSVSAHAGKYLSCVTTSFSHEFNGSLHASIALQLHSQVASMVDISAQTPVTLMDQAVYNRDMQVDIAAAAELGSAYQQRRRCRSQLSEVPCQQDQA